MLSFALFSATTSPSCEPIRRCTSSKTATKPDLISKYKPQNAIVRAILYVLSSLVLTLMRKLSILHFSTVFSELRRRARGLNGLPPVAADQGRQTSASLEREAIRSSSLVPSPFLVSCVWGRRCEAIQFNPKSTTPPSLYVRELSVCHSAFCPVSWCANTTGISARRIQSSVL